MAKKLGYFESLNRRDNLQPSGAFATAGPDTELLDRPALHVYIITQSPATIIINGGYKLQPRHIYADGIHEYECDRVEIRRPAEIRSVRISEGTAYKYKIDQPTVCFKAGSK